MTAGRVRSTIRLAMLMALPCIGCDVPTTCVARGESTVSAGTATYSGQWMGPNGSTPLTGAIPASVTIDDASAACTYDHMEFTIHVGTCRLWAQIEPTSSGDAGTGFGATIEPGQACDLPLAGGSVSLGITSGLLRAGDTVFLDLAGTVTARGDAGERGDGAGYVSWAFVGM